MKPPREPKQIKSDQEFYYTSILKDAHIEWERKKDKLANYILGGTA